MKVSFLIPYFSVVFDDKLMTANAFVFLLAGYDTTATTISFLLYELAANPDIQDAVYAEIQENIKKYNGVTYSAVKEMVLLDQALSGTLMHPAFCLVIGFVTEGT